MLVAHLPNHSLMFFLQTVFFGCMIAVSSIKLHGIPQWSCNEHVMRRSAAVPQSVHSLRFADIDVIGAIGDSLTAANGAGAMDENDSRALLEEYRGLAFSVGGCVDLDWHVTLANILKKFNPNLFGFSVGTGPANDWATARLNAAVPGAKAINLTSQAIDLVQRFRDHPEAVDIERDWKLIHVFIGGNDICDWCLNPVDASPALFGRRIAEAIQIIKDNLPRTIVVITGMMDITLLREVGATNARCTAYHARFCPCLQKENYSNAQLRGVCKGYMIEEDQLQFSDAFNDRDDFTVVVQPFLENNDRAPRSRDGSVDLSLFAPDCFHFSAYGHAVIAKNLWNNMLQPLLSKSRHANLTDISTPLNCPDPSCPFIRTIKNSFTCDEYMTPASQ